MNSAPTIPLLSPALLRPFDHAVLAHVRHLEAQGNDTPSSAHVAISMGQALRNAGDVDRSLKRLVRARKLRHLASGRYCLPQAQVHPNEFQPTALLELVRGGKTRRTP